MDQNTMEVIKINCNICPVRDECTSARGVAARSLVDTEKAVLDRVQSICPLEEIMYTTFGLVVHNIRSNVAGNE